MSTHPETVTESSMRLFKEKGGCLVELGVQPLDRDVFEKAGVKVIRIGLHPSEELNSKAVIIAEPYHASFGEMARSRQMGNKIMNIFMERLST